LEIAGLKRQSESPLKLLRADQVEAFGKALKSKLAESGPFAKQYLLLLVSRIKIARNSVEMRGSYDALAGAIEQSRSDALVAVPSFAPRCLPNQGSSGRSPTIAARVSRSRQCSSPIRLSTTGIDFTHR